MTAWDDVLAEVKRTLNEVQTEAPFFRGHADEGWPLLPGIARLRPTHDTQRPYRTDGSREVGLYLDFVVRAGELLPRDDPWTHAFMMQHHGLPTRLLDWTEVLGVAIYFAVHGATDTAAIWILDPYELNERSWGSETLPNPRHLDADYAECFIDQTKSLDAPVIALTPLYHNPRLSRQRAGFTLHSDISKPLEVLYPDAVRKVLIPKEAFAGAREFLRYGGISEFSLFPDLDALARELKHDHC